MINDDIPALTQRFTVIQGFLTEHSAFFEAACRNEWLESTTRTIRLPDVNENTFFAYLYWMHKEKIPFDDGCERGACPTIYDNEARPTLDEINKLWLLADRLMTAKLRNAAADAIVSILDIIDPESEMENVFPADTIALIWPTTTKDRAIRRIVIDFYAYMVHPETIEDNIKNYHPDFVRDLALNGLGITGMMTRNVHPARRRAGHYHELDKPHPQSHIHGNATIEFKDRDGASLQAQSSLLATPRDCIDAVNKVTNCSDADPEVKIQVKDDGWAVVKEKRWDDSLGKVSYQGTSTCD